ELRELGLGLLHLPHRAADLEVLRLLQPAVAARGRGATRVGGRRCTRQVAARAGDATHARERRRIRALEHARRAAYHRVRVVEQLLRLVDLAAVDNGGRDDPDLAGADHALEDRA